MATAAQILNLANGSGNNEYNLGVGFDSGHTDITPSTLYGGWSDSYYFFPKPDNSAVVFRMKVTGGRTSSNTKYPRCELREMDLSNTGSNDPKAAWNGSSGTHWMRGKTKIVHVPNMKPWICFAQIHNGGSDVIRLQTEGTSPTSLKLVARHTPPGGSEVVTTIQSSYTLGQVIDWKLECIGGTIKVYLGGVVKYTGSGAYTGCYFKAGLYLQSSVNNVNNTEGGDTSQYGEIELYDFMTWHTGAPTPAATYYEVNGGGGSNVPTSVNAGFDATINNGTAFNRTATEAGSAAITSRKWTVQSAPAGVGGGSSTPEVVVGQTTKMTESFGGTLSSTLWSSVQTHSYDGSASGYGTGSDYRLKVNYNAGTDHPSVLRTEVHDGDIVIGSHERSEISSFGKSWNDSENEECWYEFDVKFGDPTWSPSFSGSDDWLIFFQWHQVNDDGSPPLALSVHNDNKVYVEREPDTDFEFMGPVWTVRPGVWEHVVVHIKWSPNSSIGFIQIHLNGTEVLPKTFRKTMYQNDRTDPYYVKMGQYRRVNISGTTIVQHDNIRVSTTPPTTGSSGGGTSIVGTQIGSAAALSWTPPAVGAYTLRYSVTTAQGTFFDDVVVNVVTPGSGGGTPTTSTLGKTTAGSTQSASSTVKAAVSKFTASASGTIKTGHAHAWLDAAGSVATKLIVYANNAGAPGAKLCESDVKTLTNTTDVVQDYTFSGGNQAAVTSGTDYWVGLAWNDPGTQSLNLGRDGTASGRQEVTGFSWPTLPDPYGTPTAQTGPVAVWVDVETPPVGDSYTPPTFVGMTSDNGTTSSLLLAPPAGLASGDHQMIVVDLATVNETFPSTPNGFVEAGKFSYSSVNDGGDTWQGAVYISNNSTVTGDITLPKGGNRLMQAHRLAWRGGPGFDLETDVLRQATEGTTITLPDMFGQAGDLIVSGAINDRGGTTVTTFSTPSGWTERVNANSTSSFPDKLNIGVWEIARTADGTQTGSFSISPSDDPAVFSIRLKRIVTPGTGGSGSTPGAAPQFVAGGPGKSGTSATITLDSIGTTSGQMDVIAILSAGGESMTTVPAGWQLMDTIQGAGPTGAPGGPYTGWLYYNTDGAGSASFTKSGTRFWHAVRNVWSGQHLLGEHKVYAEASGSGGTSHEIPSVIVINPNSRVVGICMQDLQDQDPGPYSPPAAWTERYDVTMSAVDEREAITVADFVATTPGQISGAFSGTVADEAILFAFVLEAPPPTGGGGTSGTKLEAAQAILDRLQTPLAEGDFFEDWSYTGMPAVVVEWNDELLADYVAATGPYTFPDDIDTGQVQGWLQSFIEANSGGGGGTPGPTGSPMISAGADAAVAVNDTFTRTATEEDNGSVITSRLWTIISGPDQAGSTMSTAALLSWQFTKAGTYVIAYQATNAVGTSVDTITVTVTQPGAGPAVWRRTNGWFILQ